jgi:hypothetical protein
MKLYIPELGDRLKLEEDWSFEPVLDRRNLTIFEGLMDKEKWNSLTTTIFNRKNNELINKNFPEKFDITLGEFKDLPKELISYSSRYNNYSLLYNNKEKLLGTEITIPKDSILKVDRIYIRKGADDYSSVTFYIESIPGIKFKKKIRFFASLRDVNNIEVSVNRLNFLKIGKKNSELKNLIEHAKYYSLETRSYYSTNKRDINKEVNVFFENKEILKIKLISDEIITNVIFGNYRTREEKTDLKYLDWNLQVIYDETPIYQSKDEKEIRNFIDNFVFENFIKV